MAAPKAIRTITPYFKDCKPLGVLAYNNTQGLFVQRGNEVKTTFSIVWEEAINRFGLLGKEVSIRYSNGTKENPRFCSHFRFFNNGEDWTTVYIKKIRGKAHFVVATAHDIYSWIVRSSIPFDESDYLDQATDAVFVTARAKHHQLYRSGLFVTRASSSDFKKWTSEPDLLFTSRHNAFDHGPLNVIGSKRVTEGILLIYDASIKEGSATHLQAGAVLLDIDNPKKILWRSPSPIWEGLVHSEEESVVPLGVTFSERINKQHTEQELTLYWTAADGSILKILIPLPASVFFLTTPPERRYLNRHAANPILTAKQHHEWEDEAVFNPAAIYDNGRVHLLYRAIGHHGLSVLGYTSSADGLRFDERLSEPVFAMPTSQAPSALERHYGPTMYPSGGSWGGVEDPRIVSIDDTLYLTFTAFDTWSSIRIGCSTISHKDFQEQNWHWSEPLLLSPAGERHKNWVLFPEKIKGKFAILHSINPEIQIAYVNDLEDLATGKQKIRSTDPLSAREANGRWDARTRGVGPPPIRTPAGWLILYHGHEKTEPSKYKLGALLLDLKNPEKIIGRTTHPILAPDMWYENDGKPGVVYACGAVVHNDTLSVYYGGADHHVCVASMSLGELLEKMQK